MTKEPEYWRKEDHQGVNSCLVVEGVPTAGRSNPWAFANVLQVHAGQAVIPPVNGLVCKMETT
jgi:hypothetical protein